MSSRGCVSPLVYGRVASVLDVIEGRSGAAVQAWLDGLEPVSRARRLPRRLTVLAVPPGQAVGRAMTPRRAQVTSSLVLPPSSRPVKKAFMRSRMPATVPPSSRTIATNGSCERSNAVR
jgi:hypothetical protein